MKAAVFRKPGIPLSIEEVADPEPGPDDLILKVKACGICGTDLHWSQGIDPSAGWRHLAPGSVMGHEFSGEVASAAGSGSSRSRSSAVAIVMRVVLAVLIVAPLSLHELAPTLPVPMRNTPASELPKPYACRTARVFMPAPWSNPWLLDSTRSSGPDCRSATRCW